MKSNLETFEGFGEDGCWWPTELQLFHVLLGLSEKYILRDALFFIHTFVRFCYDS